MSWTHFQNYWYFSSHCWIPLKRVDSPTKGQQCGALVFPLLLTWTRCWTNGWFASDLWCHNAREISLYCMTHTCTAVKRQTWQWQRYPGVADIPTVLDYTVRCRYNAVNFLQNPCNRHPIARPWGEVWGVCCDFRIWFTFCHCYRSVVCNIVINWTAL